jgi:hypothetical protein
VRSCGDGIVSAPRGVAAVDDSIFVADPGGRKILEFDRQGTLRRAIGNDWVLPYDVAVDETRIFAVDAPKLLDSLKVGDLVEATLIQGEALFVEPGGKAPKKK